MGSSAGIRPVMSVLRDDLDHQTFACAQRRASLRTRRHPGVRRRDRGLDQYEFADELWPPSSELNAQRMDHPLCGRAVSRRGSGHDLQIGNSRRDATHRRKQNSVVTGAHPTLAVTISLEFLHERLFAPTTTRCRRGLRNDVSRSTWAYTSSSRCRMPMVCHAGAGPDPPPRGASCYASQAVVHRLSPPTRQRRRAAHHRNQGRLHRQSSTAPLRRVLGVEPPSQRPRPPRHARNRPPPRNASALS